MDMMQQQQQSADIMSNRMSRPEDRMSRQEDRMSRQEESIVMSSNRPEMMLGSGSGGMMSRQGGRQIGSSLFRGSTAVM